MQIVCPQCTTSYRIAPAMLGEAGRSVRCVRCQNVWHATAAETIPEPAMAEAMAGADAGPGSGAASDPAAAEAESAETVRPFLRHHGELGPSSHPVPGTAESGETTIVADAPSIVPPASPDTAAESAGREDVESFAARRTRVRQARKSSLWARPNLPAAILGLIGIIAVVLGWRSHIVRWLPQTATFYEMVGLPVNLRGLDFQAIKSIREIHEGIPVLVVEGHIVATTGRTVEVPRLRFAVRDEAGKEIYTWTAMPTRTSLAPGETLAFRSRLASPPAEGRDVSVRFFKRRDALSGAK